MTHVIGIPFVGLDKLHRIKIIELLTKTVNDKTEKKQHITAIWTPSNTVNDKAEKKHITVIWTPSSLYIRTGDSNINNTV